MRAAVGAATGVIAGGATLAYICAMEALPAHTRRLVQKLLAGYCRRICPPSFRQQVVLDYRIEGSAALLYEIRSFCGVPGARREVPIARLRHAIDGWWQLEHADLAGRWRRVRARAGITPRSRSFLALLRAIDEDPDGLFWGRVNGKSLRWCSSRGRCMGCAQRYGEILGTTDAESPAGATVAALR